MGIRILIVEDEAELADFIVRGLREEGFAVEHAIDAETAWDAMHAGDWDLILLDWRLPGEDGLSVLRRYRGSGGVAPVLFLTARDAVSDRVRGLDGGADDYLCKPFSFDELLARVRALLRRRERLPDLAIAHGDVRIDLATQRGAAGRTPARPDRQGAGAAHVLPATSRTGALANADLRPRLGRELRQSVQHVGGPRDGAPPQAGSPRSSGHPNRAWPRVPLRRHFPNEGAMSLTGRFSALLLSMLALVLVGFSTALYVSARVYLDRQLGDRLTSALAILAAAAEIHHDGVEWEPQERVLPMGHDSDPERLRWMVFDDQGRRVDRSRNLVDADFPDAWTPYPGSAQLPARLVDRQGRVWRVSQRRIRPEAASASGSRAAADRQERADAPNAELLHPSLVLTVCAPLGPIETTLATLGGFLIVLSLGTWLVAALLCRRLSRRALTPLTRLVASARGLDATDAGWCLDEAGTGDELDELGRAFNELLARLHVAYERQRRFSGDASHQLRTPLTVLIGQIEVALRQERSGEEYRRILGSALGRAVQLGRIVEALMFLTRAEADAPLPECDLLDLDRWVADHLANRSAAEPAAEVILVVLHGNGAWVRAHPPLLGQLLDNLLDNARKHGRPGTPIRVETSQENDVVTLAVEDAGPGIPPEDIPHLFEPFYRSAQARRRGTPGVGLGLAVAHRIAVAFGGSLNVRSQPGKGCAF